MAAPDKPGGATTVAAGAALGGASGAVGADVSPPGARPGITPSGFVGVGVGVGVGVAGAAAGLGAAGAASVGLFLLNRPIQRLLHAIRLALVATSRRVRFSGRVFLDRTR